METINELEKFLTYLAIGNSPDTSEMLRQDETDTPATIERRGYRRALNDMSDFIMTMKDKNKA